jgi:hypothetical protein
MIQATSSHVYKMLVKRVAVEVLGLGRERVLGLSCRAEFVVEVADVQRDVVVGELFFGAGEEFEVEVEPRCVAGHHVSTYWNFL